MIAPIINQLELLIISANDFSPKFFSTAAKTITGNIKQKYITNDNQNGIVTFLFTRKFQSIKIFN